MQIQQYLNWLYMDKNTFNYVEFYLGDYHPSMKH